VSDRKGISPIGLVMILAPAICFGQGLTLSTVAGGGFSSAPLPAPAANELVQNETGVAVDSAGNIYFGGGPDNVVYKVSGGILSVAAGTRYQSGYSGDGGPATSALLNNVQGVALDSAGNLYIVDYLNYAIRKVSGGTITTIAGNGSYGIPTPGPATSSPMYEPIGVAVDASGNVYVGCGEAGGFILKVANGTLTIVAGNGIEGMVTNGAPATSQPVVSPHFLSVDAAGNVYVAASGAILEVTTAGTISTVAGNGMGGYSGDGGPATSAGMAPFGVAVDSSGNLFIADTANYLIREVSNGIITAIAGVPNKVGNACYNGPVAATSANLNKPTGIAVSGGTIYFSNSSGCVQKLAGASTSGPPSIKSGGVVSASAFGEFTSIAPGSWIEIYGSNLAADSRSWATADFQGVNAPTSLDGTSVTIGGKSAFIDYISPGQVNAQVPSTAPTGSQSVVVTTPSGATTPFAITVNATQPGLLAPATFLLGGKQYAGALFTDGVTYVLPPGAIAGVTSRPAQSGNTIVLYGVGFGSVTPTIPAGQIVGQVNQLASPVQIFLGGIQAQVTYAGLAPGNVGLYQFNVVVPTLPANNLTPLTFTLGGIAGTQMLYTAVQ
jgi:uncharacterized protein (TIGR03437 family)